MEYKKYTLSCKINGCMSPYYAKELCKRHYKIQLGLNGGYKREYEKRKTTPEYKEMKRKADLAYREKLKKSGLYKLKNREQWKKWSSNPENIIRKNNKQHEYHLRNKNNPAYLKRNAENQKRSRYKIKLEAFTHYSTNGEIKCAKCGFLDVRALGLDHINNDGIAHKKTINAKYPRQVTGTLVYRDLKRRGWPTGFQILCYNCNWIKYIETLNN